MSEYSELKRVMEDNFVLQSLETRELKAEMFTHLGTVGKQIHVLNDRMHVFNDQMHVLNDQMHVLNDQMRVVSEQMQVLSDHSQAVAGGLDSLAENVDRRLERQAERWDAAVAALRALGDGSTDVRKEIAELRERVRRLKERAS